jgi:hypothetical protein
LTGKQKIQNALEHIEGPVPVDFGSNPVTGMHVQMVEKIREYLGLEYHPVKIIDPFQMLGEVDEEVLTALGIDAEALPGKNTLFGFPLEGWKEWKAPWGQVTLVPEGFKTTLDNEGNTYIYPQGDTSVRPSGKLPVSGFYFDAVNRQCPIIEEELDPKDNLEEFPLLGDDDFNYFREQAQLCKSSNRFVFGSLTGDTGLGDIARVPGLMLKDPKGIRDEAEWYMSTLIRQDYLHAVFTEQTDRAVINLKKIHEILGDTVNGVFICGTDFGTQTNQFISPEHFRLLYMPYYRKVNDWIHANTSWKTMKHSCGAIEPLMNSFIEAGFDIINPVQITAAGMDPRILKDRYGDRITFWGGGIDTQAVLPFGTPEDVRRQVLEHLEIFSRGGGYVFNSGHNLQAKVPVENFMAMIAAVREFNGEHRL